MSLLKSFLLPSAGNSDGLVALGLQTAEANPELIKNALTSFLNSLPVSETMKKASVDAINSNWSELHAVIMKILTSVVGAATTGRAEPYMGAAEAVPRQTVFQKRLAKFIEELKSSGGAFAEMPLPQGDDIGPTVAWFKKSVPMGPINRITLQKTPNTIKIAKLLAAKLNSAFSAGINLTAPDAQLVRDVLVALAAVQAGLSADYVMIYSAMNHFADNINLLMAGLSTVAKEVKTITPDQTGRLDSVSAALQVLQRSIGDNADGMRRLLHGDALRELMGPEEYANTESSRRYNALLKLEDVKGSEQVVQALIGTNKVFEVANTIARWHKSLLEHAKKILEAFFDPKVNTDAFRELITERLKDSKLDAAMIDQPAGFKATSLHEALRMLEGYRQRLDAGNVADIGKALKEDGLVMGNGERRGGAAMIQGTNIRSQIERAKEGRNALMKAAITRISGMFAGVTNSIQALITGVMDGSVPASAGLRNVQNDLALLKEMGKKDLIFPLLGVYVAPEMGAERNRFISALMNLRTRTSGLTAESQIYGRLESAIKTLLDYIEQAQTQHRETYNRGISTFTGSAEPDVDILPQLKTAMVRYTESLQELSYAVNFHQGLRRMQRAGKDMEGSEAQHASARAEAFGQKQSEIKLERDELLNTLADTPTVHATTGQLFDANDKTERDAARAMISDMYEAKLNMCKTAEAFDGMIEKFVRAIAINPLVLRELYKEIAANPGIADWYHERSGDTLVEWFELFPVYGNDLGNPVGKATFSVTSPGHYYDMLATDVGLIDYATKTPAGAARHLFPYYLGNHLVPHYPSAYMAHKKKARQVFQSTAALKNLLTAFVNVAKQLGDEKIFSFMTPTTMYQNLIEYMATSAFNRGYSSSGNGVQWVDGVTPGINRQHQLNNGFSDLRDGDVQYDANNRSRDDATTRIWDLDLGGANILSTFPAGTNGLNTIYMGSASTYAVGGVPVLGPDILRKINARTMFGFTGAVVYEQMKSMFDDTDMLLVTMLQGMYAKIMTAVNVDKMLHRPLARSDFLNVRSFVGGDEPVPDIRPEFMRVYFGLILLAEFYRDLFNLKNHGSDLNAATADRDNIGTDWFISMLPEGASPFGELIACVFDRYASITQGEYSDIQARNLINICNRIIDAIPGPSSDERIDRIFDDFISEVNKRYAVMQETDAIAYEDWLKSALPGTNGDQYRTAGTRADDLSILPGEDDAFRFDGPAPSDLYARVSDHDMRNGQLIRPTLSTLNDRWRQLINKWRAKADSYTLDGSDASIMTWQEQSVIGDMLRSSEMDVRLAKDPYSRYVEALKLISTSSSSYGGDVNKALMLQEVVAGIDVLKEVAAQLLKATDLAYYMASPENIIEASRSILTDAGGATLGARLMELVGGNFSFSKFINIAGIQNADMFNNTLGLLWAKPSARITPPGGGFTRVVDFAAIGTIYAADRYVAGDYMHVGVDQAPFWFDKIDTHKANQLAVFEAALNHDMMFAELMQLCIDLDQFNAGALATSGSKLVDVVIREGAISVNFSALRQQVFSMLEHLQSLMNSLRSSMKNDDLAVFENESGFGIAMLRHVFVEVLFKERPTNASSDILGLGVLNQNIGKALKYFAGKRNVWLSPFVEDFVRNEWPDTILNRTKLLTAQRFVSAPDAHPITIYFPVYQDGAKPLVNFERVFRTFTHFDALLPNSGIPYAAKELRSALPIFSEVAPHLDKTKQGMYWRHEIGFPDALKMPAANDEYSSHSLLLDFNRGVFNYVNDIFDHSTSRIYSKAMNGLTLGQGSGSSRIETSYPDTLPNLNAIQAFIATYATTADSEREPFLQSLVGTSISGVTYARNGNQDPAGIIAPHADLVATLYTPFNEVLAPATSALWPTDVARAVTGLLRNYAISMEQYIIATRFFSSKLATSYLPTAALLPIHQIAGGAGVPGGINAINGDTGTIGTTTGGATTAAIINFMCLMSGVVAPNNMAGALATYVGQRVVQGAQGFVKNLHRLLPPRVPYRAPRDASVEIGWGIRRDPLTSSPFMTSVSVLLDSIANHKVEGDVGLRHQYISLADVPSYNKEALRCRTPYYMAYFMALSNRASIISSFINALPNVPSAGINSAMFEDIDPMDVDGNRTEVWGDHFKSSALQFIGEIKRTSDNIRNSMLEVYNDLTDIPRFMELPEGTPSQIANAGIALALTAFRTDDTSLGEYALALSGSPNSSANYKFLYGMRGLLGQGVGTFEATKHFPGYVEIINKYNGLVDASFKVGDELRNNYLQTFINLFRWAAGNRVFKPSLSNQYLLKLSDTSIQTALPWFNGANVAAVAAAPYLVDANSIIKFAVIYSGLVPVRNASRYNDVFSGLTNDGPSGGNNGNEFMMRTRTNVYAKLYNQQLMITSLKVTDDADGNALITVSPGKTTLGSELDSCILGFREKTDVANARTSSLNASYLSPSHTTSDLIAGSTPLSTLIGYKALATPPADVYALRYKQDATSLDLAFGVTDRRTYKKLQDIVDVVGNPDVRAKLREVIEFCMSQGAGAPVSRDTMRNLMIRYLNVVPINPNILAREVGYGHGYNQAYNFRRMMLTRLGIDSTNRKALVGRDFNELDSSANMAELWYRLLANPYARLSIVNYERLIGGFMRGNDTLDLGRPQFLSDQVYSKALFGSLYESGSDKQPGGPKSAKKTSRESTEKNFYDAFGAAHLIVGGITNLLITNEAQWMKRDSELMELLANPSYLFRVPDAQVTGITSNGLVLRPSMTTNHVFECMRGDAFRYNIPVVFVNTGFADQLLRSQILCQMIKFREIQDAPMTADVRPILGTAAQSRNVTSTSAISEMYRLDNPNPAVVFSDFVNGPENLVTVFNTVIRPNIVNGITAAAVAIGGVPTLAESIIRADLTTPTGYGMIPYGFSLNETRMLDSTAYAMPNATTWQGLYNGLTRNHIGPHMLLRSTKHDVTSKLALDTEWALNAYDVPRAAPGQATALYNAAIRARIQAGRDTLANADAEAPGFAHTRWAQYAAAINSILSNSQGGLQDGPNAPEIITDRYMAPNCGLLTPQVPRGRFALSTTISAALWNVFGPAVSALQDVDLARITVADCQTLAIESLTKSASPLARIAAKALTSLANLASYEARLPCSSPGMPHLGLADTIPATFVIGGLCSRPYNIRMDVYASSYYHQLAKLFDPAATAPAAVNDDNADWAGVAPPALDGTIFGPFLIAADNRIGSTVAKVIRRNRMTAFMSAIAIAFEVLGQLIPDSERVNLIITNALFTLNYDYPLAALDEDIWPLERLNFYKNKEDSLVVHKTGIIYRQFFENVIKHISSSESPYLPFDKTFYSVASLHNVSIAHGAEAAALSLSTTAAPTLQRIFTTPAISLPVVCARTMVAIPTGGGDTLATRTTRLMDRGLKLRTLLTQLLISDGDFASKSYTAKAQLLDRIWDECFSRQSDGGAIDGVRWTFSYTRGDHTNPMHIAAPLTEDEAVQEAKSKEILKQHAKFLLLLHHLAVKNETTAASEAQFTAMITKVEGWLTTLTQGRLFSNVSYHRFFNTQFTNIEGGFTATDPVRTMLAMASSRAYTYPIKYGVAIFDNTLNSECVPRALADNAISDSNAHGVRYVNAPIAVPEFDPTLRAVIAPGFVAMPVTRGLLHNESTARLSVNNMLASANGVANTLAHDNVGGVTERSIQAELAVDIVNALVHMQVPPELKQILTTGALKNTVELGMLYAGLSLTYQEAHHVTPMQRASTLESELFWAPIRGFENHASYVYTQYENAVNLVPTAPQYDPVVGAGTINSMLLHEIAYIKMSGIDFTAAPPDVPAALGVISRNGNAVAPVTTGALAVARVGGAPVALTAAVDFKRDTYLTAAKAGRPYQLGALAAFLPSALQQIAAVDAVYQNGSIFGSTTAVIADETWGPDLPIPMVSASYRMARRCFWLAARRQLEKDRIHFTRWFRNHAVDITNGPSENIDASTAFNGFPLALTGDDYKNAQTRDISVPVDLDREYTFHEPYKVTYLGTGGNVMEINATASDGDAMRKIGKYRFDSKIVRNLLFIHNLHNLLAYDIEAALTDLSKAVVHGRNVFNPRLHEFTANRSQTDEYNARTRDTSEWAPITMN